MFWGLLFLVIGVIIIIQTVFKIDLPILRLLFGFVLIYLGVKVVFGSFGMKVSGFTVEKIATQSEAAFSDVNFKFRNADGTLNKSFSTAFSKSTLDLKDIKPEELESTIKIASGFSSLKVLTPEGLPIKAQISSGFSNIKIRGQKIGTLGDTEYQSPGFSATAPHLKLQIEAGFGNITVE